MPTQDLGITKPDHTRLSHVKPNQHNPGFEGSSSLEHLRRRRRQKLGGDAEAVLEILVVVIEVVGLELAVPERESR